MENSIKKFVIMSDILRISSSEKFYTDRSCKWFFYLFNRQIKSSVNLPVEIELGQESKIFDRELFYRLAGYEQVSEENYLEIAKGNIISEAVSYFQSCFKDCFIIFQEAGALKQVADLANLQYLDIIISSIRFLEDLNFAFRTNVPEIAKILLKYRLPEEKIYFYANKVKAYYWARESYKNNLKDDSLLLCGQTKVDLSLIKNNKLVSFLDYKEDIENLCNSYTNVYYKPHPYAKPENENEKLIRSFKNVQIIDENFYKLLTCKEITAVAALSSGTVKEAKYFGKKTHFISHPFINYYYNDSTSIEADDFIIIDDSYYSSQFWGDILSPVAQTNTCSNFNFLNKSNSLRESLNVWWGYEIDNWHSVIQNEISKIPACKINEIIIKNRTHNRRILLNDELEILLPDCKQDKNIEISSNALLIKDFDNLPLVSNYKRNLFEHTKDSNMNIDTKDISVVVQGAINKNITPKCLKSIRDFLPDSEIILSTWQGADVEGLDYDILILNEDPGAVKTDLVNNVTNNQNRQLVSTREGIKKAGRKFVLKIRTDFILHSAEFLTYWNKFLSRKPDYNIFRHRIIVSSVFSREFSDYNQRPVLFHPSDFFLFGLTEDLFDYFENTRFATNEELGDWQCLYPNRLPYPEARYRYAPEQFFLLSYAKQFFPDLIFEDWTDWNEDNMYKSNYILYNNFIFLDYKQSGIYSEKFASALCNSNKISGLITFDKFQSVYQKDFDENYAFDTKKDIYKSLRKYYKYSFKCKKHLAYFLNPLKKIITWLWQPIPILCNLIKLFLNKCFIKRMIACFIFDKQVRRNFRGDI